jgi:preprotein translocase subunit YajC
MSMTIMAMIAVGIKLGIIVFLLMMVFYFVRAQRRIAVANEQMAKSQAETARHLAELAARARRLPGE